MGIEKTPRQLLRRLGNIADFSMPMAQKLIQALMPHSDALPKQGESLAWKDLYGSADILAVAEMAARESRLILLIAANSAAAQRWHAGIGFFAPELPNLLFPDWETLPYDLFSPHQDITSERLATLHALSSLDQGILTVPITTLLQRVAPNTYLQGTSFDLPIQLCYMHVYSSNYRHGKCCLSACYFTTTTGL